MMQHLCRVTCSTRLKCNLIVVQIILLVYVIIYLLTVPDAETHKERLDYVKRFNKQLTMRFLKLL